MRKKMGELKPDILVLVATVMLMGVKAQVTQPESIQASVMSVRHMEPDLFADDRTLFTDGNTIKSVVKGQGVNTADLIAGSSRKGYQEGAGAEARFNNINGFVQLSSTMMVIADTDNNCLRYLDRTTNTTSLFAGQCSPSNTSINGPRLNATFQSPYKIITDVKRPETILLTEGDRAIRRVSTDGVSTFYKFSRSIKVGALAQDKTSGDLFVTTMNTNATHRHHSLDLVRRVSYQRHSDGNRNVSRVSKVDVSADHNSTRFRINDLFVVNDGTRVFYLHFNGNYTRFETGSGPIIAKNEPLNNQTDCGFQIRSMPDLRTEQVLPLAVMIDGKEISIGYSDTLDQPQIRTIGNLPDDLLSKSTAGVPNGRQCFTIE